MLASVVLLTAVFQFYQEAKSDSIMEGFKKLIPVECVVVRGGEKRNVDATTLVMGDIVEVKAGDKIPADMRIVKCSNFKVRLDG